jgi:putative sterol carrier protein
MLVGATRFNDLARGLPGLSRTLLSKRLQQFEEAGLVDKVGTQYHLTQAGRDLEPVVFGIGEWGAKWSFDDPMVEELDSELLVWWMHTRLNTSDLPGSRQVFHFRFSDDPKLFWIVVENGIPSVCKDDPGYEVNLTLNTDVATLYKVWEARIGLRDAILSGALNVSGQRAYTSRLGDILQFSPVAPIVGAAHRFSAEKAPR